MEINHLVFDKFCSVEHKTFLPNKIYTRKTFLYVLATMNFKLRGFNTNPSSKYGADK